MVWITQLTTMLAGLTAACSVLCAGETNELAAFVDSIGEREIELGEVVGLTIGIAHKDETLCIRGYGMANAELQVPASADTVYRVGSITKEFTAAAILMLEQEGKISLEDPLQRFLPEFPVKEHTITIRHLLQHTSGVKDFTRLPAYRKEIRNDVSQAEVLNRFQHLPLNFAPGEKYRYSNSGYFLLGVIIEKASGKPFEEYVQERLFGPLKLKHTYCDSATRIIAHRAAGYSRWNGVLRNAGYISLKQTVGAGNLASTAGDLLTWQRALANDGLLSAETSKRMRTRGKLNDGSTISYGMGLVVKKSGGREVVRHGGGILGFRSELAHYPQSGYTIVVLANSENAKPARISEQIARYLHKLP